jgi:phospholipase/carboxylesterase
MLLRAMVPLSKPPKADLVGKPVLIVSGQLGPIIPPDNSDRLAAMLTNASADVQQFELPVGHELSQADVAIARKWMSEQTAVVSAKS